VNEKYRTYKVITPAAALPVDLQRVYDHLRRDSDAGDEEYVQLLVRAAASYVEQRCGLALITQTIEDTHDGFPAGDPLELRIAPVQSVTHVKYLDTDGAEQTWDAANYVQDLRSIKARIGLTEDATYPDTQGVLNAVTVRYVAGYGDTAASVPHQIQQAILLMVGRMYDNREDSVHNMPTAAQHLLEPFVTDLELA